VTTTHVPLPAELSILIVPPSLDSVLQPDEA
jgi:hypothetical protein